MASRSEPNTSRCSREVGRSGESTVGGGIDPVNRWRGGRTYNQVNPWNRYLHRNQPVGYRGNDLDDPTVEVRGWFARTLRGRIAWRQSRQSRVGCSSSGGLGSTQWVDGSGGDRSGESMVGWTTEEGKAESPSPGRHPGWRLPLSRGIMSRSRPVWWSGPGPSSGRWSGIRREGCLSSDRCVGRGCAMWDMCRDGRSGGPAGP
jgi:hypothetical protein